MIILLNHNVAGGLISLLIGVVVSVILNLLCIERVCPGRWGGERGDTSLVRGRRQHHRTNPSHYNTKLHILVQLQQVNKYTLRCTHLLWYWLFLKFSSVSSVHCDTLKTFLSINSSIHSIEKRALPEFFNGKNKSKSPEMWVLQTFRFCNSSLIRWWKMIQMMDH